MPITQAKLISIITIAEIYKAYQDELKRIGREIYEDPNPARSWQSRFEELAQLIHSVPIKAELESELYIEKRHIIRTMSQNQYRKEYMKRKRAEADQSGGQLTHSAKLNLDLANLMTKQSGLSFAQQVEEKRKKMAANKLRAAQAADPANTAPFSLPSESGLEVMRQLGVPIPDGTVGTPDRPVRLSDVQPAGTTSHPTGQKSKDLAANELAKEVIRDSDAKYGISVDDLFSE